MHLDSPLSISKQALSESQFIFHLPSFPPLPPQKKNLNWLSFLCLFSGLMASSSSVPMTGTCKSLLLHLHHHLPHLITKRYLICCFPSPFSLLVHALSSDYHKSLLSSLLAIHYHQKDVFRVQVLLREINAWLLHWYAKLSISDLYPVYFSQFSNLCHLAPAILNQ